MRSRLGNGNVAVDLAYLSRDSCRARKIQFKDDSRLYIMKCKDKVFINLVQIFTLLEFEMDPLRLFSTRQNFPRPAQFFFVSSQAELIEKRQRKIALRAENSA